MEKRIIITKNSEFVGQPLDLAANGTDWQYRTIGQGRDAVLRGAYTFSLPNAELARHVAINHGAGISII